VTIRAAILACVLALATTARAQPEVTTSDKPWAAGISETEQATALALYTEGNSEFQAARFAQALAKYTEAIKHWDHPAIHFNMAVCLINLDQPLDAKLHLDRALAYGVEPLGADMYAQGITYQHSLDGQLSRVRIACKEPGATVTFDGTFAFTAPGEIDRIVMPGRHQVVATKPGFQTATEALDLLPSKSLRYDVRLVAFKAATRLERRWSPWQPYAVLAGGAGTVGLGALAYLLASNAFARYDAAVSAACPHGCDAQAAALFQLDVRKQRGDVEQDVAFSLFAVGGAAVITGVVGIVLNQPRAVEEHPVAVVRSGSATLLTWATAW
jgi:tetratricopeptide (TPR) repeat protein